MSDGTENRRRTERGSGLGEGNAVAVTARRILRWGHPRSPLRRTIILSALVVLWLALGIIGWQTWAGRNGIEAGGPLDLPYLTLWLLTPQGDVTDVAQRVGNEWVGMPWTLNLARYLGAAIPLLGVVFLAGRQIGDALAESLMQLWGGDHLVVIGHGREAVQAADAARAEKAAVVLIDPTISDPAAEDLNQLGVLVIRDDLKTAAQKAALHRARRIVVVGSDATLNLSQVQRAAEVMDPEADLHVQIEDENILEMMRQSAAVHTGRGPAPRPFSLAAAAARRANEDLRLWDRPGGLKIAALSGGAFSHAMVRQALSLGWRIGRPPPEVVLWDPTGEVEDRWSRMAPGVLGDLKAIYEGPPFSISFSKAKSIGAFLKQTADSTAWIVENDAGMACEAALLASRMQPGPVVVVSGEHPLEGTLPTVHLAVSGFSAGFEAAILPQADRWAQQLHEAYETRGRTGHIALGAAGSGVRWAILAESLWAANRASAQHIKVKLADADEAGADPRDDRDLLQRMAEVEHDRWCAERLLNGWRPGDRDEVQKLHPGLVGWTVLDEPTRDKDRDGVIDAFRVARPR